MSKPAGHNASQRQVLLLWVLRTGPAQLHGLVRSLIKLLYQSLLPKLWEQFRNLPVSKLSPIWQAARKAAARLIHSRLAQYCYHFLAAWLGLPARPTDRSPHLPYQNSTDVKEHSPHANKGTAAHQVQPIEELLSHNGPKLEDAAKSEHNAKHHSVADAANSDLPSTALDTLQHGKATGISPRDHILHDYASHGDHRSQGYTSPRTGDGMEGIGRHQTHTPRRRERMPGNWSTGAAWLQAQATSAAAAAAAAVSSSSSSSHDSPAPPLAAAPSPTPLAAGQPPARPASKHRHHTSLAPLSTHEQALSSTAKGRALSPAGRSAAALNTPHGPASEPTAMTHATYTASDRTPSAVSSSAVFPLTAQESLDRAAAALQALQQKFSQPHADRDSTQERPNGPDPVKLAVQPSRSSFDFRSAIAGMTSATDPAPLPQTRGNVVQAHQHQHQHSDGSFDEPDVVSGPGQVSLAAVSRRGMAQPASQVASAVAAGEAAPAQQEACNTGLAMPGHSSHAIESPPDVTSLHLDDISQPPHCSGNQAGAHESVSVDSSIEADAGGQELHGLSNQSDNSDSFQAGPARLSTGHCMGQSQTGPGMHRQGSPSLVTDGQVLEGQGTGQFLGPPAQRWAAASTLKDSMNKMPLSPEETANAPASQRTPTLPSAPPVGAQQCDTDHVEAGSVKQSREGWLNKSNMRPNRRVRFDLQDIDGFRHDQENIGSR